MLSQYVLMEYYIKYLQEVRKLSDSSVKHYIDALNNISRYLVKYKKIKRNIYEIENICELEIIKEYLYNDSDFIEQDRRGHQMYSAGLNNYYRFVSGEGIKKIKNNKFFDIKIPAKGKGVIEHETWERSNIIKRQSIELANYLCEINSNHKTFMVESSQHQYMEAHHVIPIHKQKHFLYSLDVYANIMCLCPTCHRLMHYGLKDDKEKLLNQIYDERIDRLERSGIKLEKNEFIKIVI